MSSAMLSRFDLVFLLLDRPDEALDHSLSEHVLALHSGEPPQAWASFSSSAWQVMCPTGGYSAMHCDTPCCSKLYSLLKTSNSLPHKLTAELSCWSSCMMSCIKLHA